MYRSIEVSKYRSMLFSCDMKDLLKLIERHKVQYVPVGGYAVNYYGYIRMTQDIDVLIYPSTENAEKVMAALIESGSGGAGIPQEYLAGKDFVIKAFFGSFKRSCRC